MIHHPRKLAPQPPLPKAATLEAVARRHVHTAQILTSTYHSGQSYGNNFKDALEVHMMDIADPDTPHMMKLPVIRDIYSDMDITKAVNDRRSTMSKRVLTQMRNRREIHRFAAWCFVRQYLNNKRDPEITPYITSTQLSDDAVEDSGAGRFCGWSTWHHTIITVTP